MTQALLLTHEADDAFRDIYNTARKRNTTGVASRSPYACAEQHDASHMWHHEDAGVGFNVFRAVVAANSSAAIVPVPGHFNDAGIIERTQSAQDRYWSSRSVFVHGIKGPSQYTAVHSKWHLHRKDAPLGLRCYPCNQPGINMHHGDWTWARLPCPPSIDGSQCAVDGAACPQQERFCPVQPAKHFTCCGWPWILPEVTNLISEVLRAAPNRSVPATALLPEMRRELRRRGERARDPPGCIRDCVSLLSLLPGPNSMPKVLDELVLRGEVQRWKGAYKEWPSVAPGGKRRGRGRMPPPATHMEMVSVA